MASGHPVKKETKLRKIKESKNLTAKDIAASAGINITRFQQYEYGYRSINKAEALVVYRITKAIGCEMSDILEDE